MRRLFSLLAAAILAVGAVGSSASPAAALGGTCAVATHSFYQVYVEKYVASSTYITDVSGQSKIVGLNICTYGAFAGNGGTFVMPANLQNDTTKRIYQLGYGRTAIDSAPYFFYAEASPDAVKITSPRPVDGHTYTFHIYRRSAGYVSYDIRDMTTGLYVWTYYPTTPFNASSAAYQNHAWWGFESWDSESALGYKNGQAITDIRDITYTPAGGVQTWRSGMTCASVGKTFDWDGSGGAPCSLAVKANIDSIHYSGDTLRVYSSY